MGRKRKAGTEWMPQRVYKGHAAYEYHPAAGGSIRLCSLDATQRLVWVRYEEELARLEMKAGSFAELVNDFFESKAFTTLAPRTQKDYITYGAKVLKVFGKMACLNISPKNIRMYMDKRGAKSEVQANREHSFMSKVFGWGYERGLVTVNPCLKVRKFTELSRTRYITDMEYSAVLECSSPMMQAAMEISYCCAARQGDVLALKRDDLREEGIYIKQGKTNKEQIKRWNPRLKAAVDLVLANQKVKSMRWVMSDETGVHITETRLRHWYTAAKIEATSRHPSLKFDFTFHDIKAKSISDYEGNKQEFSGHKTAAQVAVYDRKIKVVDTND
jgi:integrase